jgi:putative ABC transport system permease protein
MLKNNLKIAFRNLWRNKTYTAINMVGLAVGLAVFLLIFEFIAFEWSSNRFHKNYDNIYRVGITAKNGNTSFYVPPGFAPMLKEKIPGVEAAVRVADGISGGVIGYAGNPADKQITAKSFREEKMLYVDGDFLQVFTFKLIDGTPSLSQPKTLALSETMAKKLFGKTNVAGKTITISDQFGNTPYTVNAVFEDMPAESDIKTEVLLSIHTLESAANRDGNDWADPSKTESGFTNIFILLKKGVDEKLLGSQVTGLFRNVNPNDPIEMAALQPLNHIHLAPDFNYPYQTFGSLKFVVMLLSVALLILIIAWVNYINLSTVQSLTRAKETGVRKVLGANRVQLTLQYLSETFVLSLAAVAIAFFLVQLFQNTFNGFTGRALSLQALNQGWFWFFSVLIILTGSLLSGGYVALVLSSFKPVKTIRGKVGNATKGISLRKGLVVFQFSVSIIFIIATLILYQQLTYMKTSDPGINLTQLVVIKGPTVSGDEQAEKNYAFKNLLAQLPFVKKYAASNNVPGGGYNFSTAGIARLNPQKDDDKKNYSMFISDERFFDTYGISFAEGKTFTPEEAVQGWNNSLKVIINEKAAAQLGFLKPANAVGQKITWDGKQFEIAGVVKDYHHLSMHKPIEPVVYLPSVSFVYFTIQTDATNMKAKLTELEKYYKQYFPGNPFEYFFADERYNSQYNTENQLGNVFTASALVAIFIACLGLFGLAVFTSKQRVKEIGIRKVLGASVFNIAKLLSVDFLKLVLIAAIIAFPVAWFAMHKWLQDYAYRVNISLWVFALAGLTALLIAIVTVSFQAIKAAVANPVKSLRTE